MIRDPSDGSVKGINPEANEINTIAAKTPLEEITSGLPFPSAKPEHQARLQRSREWLKQYRLDQGAATSTAERSSENEGPSDVDDNPCV